MTASTMGKATVIQANSRRLPMGDDTVDLIVTSPPYFALRSYTDAGEHYAGQVGDEPTPQEFLDSLIEVTRECILVLKQSGSLWVNLGDKYVADNRGSGGDKKRGQAKHAPAGPAGYPTGGWRQKSLMGLPWRYAIRCVDELGLILRAEVVWSKPNGLPESVTDRVRRSHEQWFHFTLQPRYFSGIDEIREQHASGEHGRTRGARTDRRADEARRFVGGVRREMPPQAGDDGAFHPLGKLPGSVWTVATEPLKVPDHVAHAACCAGARIPDCEEGIDHYAAFPTEWPKRIVQGWSPDGVCTACGEGRRPVVSSVGLDMSRPQARRAQELADRSGLSEEHFAALLSVGVSDTGRGAATQSGTGKNTPEVYALAGVAREALGGYAREYLLRRPTGFTYVCACPEPIAPTTPAVVLDPFGGTGTTAMVAKALGRCGVTVDMSADYCRLAAWRTTDRDQLAKVLGVAKAVQQPADQLDMFDLLAGA